MITIDIAQMHSHRSPYPGVEFRRNDNDRRPARKVIRPNDGPGDWDRRFTQAEKMRAMANTKRFQALDAESYKAQRLAQWNAETLRILEVLSEATIDLNLTGIARLALLSTDRCSQICLELADLGLIYKQTTHNGRGGREVGISITAQGRDKLAARGQ